MSVLPQDWTSTRFDCLFERVERKLVIDDNTEYSRVGVRWYGNGAFVRDRVLGDGIARKQQWVIREGDIVYNKLFAWKGAFAVADGSVDGYLVSDKFPTYSLDETKIDPRFLAQYFRTHQLAFQAERLSKGAAAISKLTLNPPQFWDLTVPLPPIAAQREVVAVLQSAETKLAQARDLRRESQAEAEALGTAAIGDRLARFPVTGVLSDVLASKPRNGWSPACDNADEGTPVLALGAVTGFVYRPTQYKRTSEPTRADGHYWLRAGDLLVTRSNTEKLLGHAAIYSGQPSPCIYPDLMMRVDVDGEQADKRFVYYWLRTPAVREQIQRAGRGTNSTMKKITQRDVMALPFPTEASLSEQVAAVEDLDRIIARIDEIRTTQRSAEHDLAALMPSLLDKAFAGELG